MSWERSLRSSFVFCSSRIFLTTLGFVGLGGGDTGPFAFGGLTDDFIGGLTLEPVVVLSVPLELLLVVLVDAAGG